MKFGFGVPDHRRLATTPQFSRAYGIASVKRSSGGRAAALPSILCILLLMFVAPRSQRETELPCLRNEANVCRSCTGAPLRLRAETQLGVHDGEVHSAN